MNCFINVFEITGKFRSCPVYTKSQANSRLRPIHAKSQANSRLRPVYAKSQTNFKDVRFAPMIILPQMTAERNPRHN